MIIILLIEKIVSVLVTFHKYLYMLRGVIVCYFILHLFVGEAVTHLSGHAHIN